MLTRLQICFMHAAESLPGRKDDADSEGKRVQSGTSKAGDVHQIQLKPDDCSVQMPESAVNF